MKAICMACGEEFEAVKGHLCEPCSKDYTVGVSKMPFLSFADQLMTAMRPLTRQIDNLCWNNELLEEILTTLSNHEDLQYMIKVWNKQKRIIKED